MTRQETDRREPREDPPASPRGTVDRRFDVLTGVVVTLLVLGPALRPGPLLEFDLLVTPEIPVPNGVFGLGPALSQRVPLFALFGVGSWLVGGPATVKLFLVAGSISGHVGMTRLVEGITGRIGRQVAGVLWIAGPFALTRIAAGHIQFVWSIALLPWLLPTLSGPSRRPARTFAALVLLAVGGPAIGVIAGLVVLIGLIVERSRRIAPVLVTVGVSNLLWAAPTAVLLWAGAEVAGADRFATSARGADGWLGIPVGGGFWSPVRQIGAGGWLAAFVGVGLVGAALLGHPNLPGWRRPLRATGFVGLGLTLASAVPIVRDLYAAASRSPVGAPLRESHRFLLLWLAWLAPAAAAGAAVMAERARTRLAGRRAAPGFGEMIGALPLAAVVLVSAGGWWGAGDALVPVEFPAGWSEARDLLRDRPGTVVALPWNQYPPLDFLDGRHAFNPLPDYLGGDVVSSYDPLFEPDEPAQEQVDRRARRLDAALRSGGPLGSAFSDVGARHAIVVEQPGAVAVTARLEAEPESFRPVLRNRDATVWEVRSWTAPVIAPDGTGHELDRPIPPVIRSDAPPGSVVGVAGAPGWVRGWFHPAGITPGGRLRMPDTGRGVLWFWPAPVLMMVDVAILGAAGAALLRDRRRPRPTSHEFTG